MVSLSKNQTVSLSKQSTALSQLQFGLGWDPVKKKGLFGSIFGGNDSIDLDAGCVLLDAAGNKIDTIWFRKLKSSCGSVVHSGDNLTGEGDGDDEIIHVNLLKLPANVEYLAFTVNSFRGSPSTTWITPSVASWIRPIKNLPASADRTRPTYRHHYRFTEPQQRPLGFYRPR